MMKKILSILAVMAILPVTASAESRQDDGGAVKKELENHFKLYGFVRNFFAFDTRESNAGTGDLFYYVPKDIAWNEDRSQDLSSQCSFRFLTLTSRLGLDVYGYEIGRTRFGAKIETDFYAGLTGTPKINGTAQLRLRQAYMTVGWDDLELGVENTASIALKLGQAWHPMAADQPHVLALETGTPFNPFSRTPQVLMDASLGEHFMISGAAIWQMQYLSTGPNGASAEYIKYGCTPEAYLGLTYRTKGGFLARAGLDILSIKPRRTGKNSDGVTVKVSDRLTTLSYYVYLQYKKGKFEARAKSVLSEGGEHMNLMSGYGVSWTGAGTGAWHDGHWEYVPLYASSTWTSISYGKKWQIMLMGGYIKNLGTRNPLYGNQDSFVTDRHDSKGDLTDASHVYFSGNGSSNLNEIWRVVPTFAYNIGKFTIALEWNITSARYGDYVEFDGGKYLYANTGLATDNLHWVTNHRIQMMTRFTF